ncbi:MAG TPA: alkaline phosphatase family protein, partial [Acidimicrobiales bacterium]|nr:alkaline phosphatase family protein [Acidimicrobiales bacterium]
MTGSGPPRHCYHRAPSGDSRGGGRDGISGGTCGRAPFAAHATAIRAGGSGRRGGFPFAVAAGSALAASVRCFAASPEFASLSHRVAGDAQPRHAVRPHRGPHDGEPFLRQLPRRLVENPLRRGRAVQLDRGAGRGWPSYSSGVYVNSDGNGNQIEPYHMDTTCDPGGVDQSWDCTHGSMYWAYGSESSSEYSTGSYNPASFEWSQPLSQVPLLPRNMAGFVIANGDVDPMGYWTAAEIPFTHSMAQAFTIANYWFCSAPCQTYPNRRFLMSGTAFGDISTDIDTIFDPSNGANAIAAPPP